MPEQFFIPFLSLSIFVPLIMSLVVWRMQRIGQARQVTALTLAVSLVALLTASVHVLCNPGARLSESFVQWFMIDALNALPMPLFAALVLGIVIFAPNRKLTSHWLAGLLWLSATTTAAYAANNLLIFALGWVGSLLPFLLARTFASPAFGADPSGATTAQDKVLSGVARFILLTSCVSLCVGFGILVSAAASSSWDTAVGLTLVRKGMDTRLMIAFVFLMGAVILRKGIFPAHSWIVTAFEQGPLLPLVLLMNGHLGAFLVARIILPLLPDVAQRAWPLFSNLGLLTAAYAALLGLITPNPRRLLALVAISQSAFLLTGLESNTSVGIAGALVLWQVVAVAATMTAAVYAALEARLGGQVPVKGWLGLAVGAPRLAVFFAAGGLALVGLPLTLGFPAEDLLLQGTLATNPYLGVVLPLVTAMNAFSMVRLFARLFLGRPVQVASHLTDALPRERWVLIVALLFLVVGGLFPAAFIRLPSFAAARLLPNPNSATPTVHQTEIPRQ